MNHEVGSWIRENALARVFHRRDGAEALAELLLAVSGKRQEKGDQNAMEDRSELRGPSQQQQKSTLSAFLGFRLRWVQQFRFPRILSEVSSRASPVHMGDPPLGFASSQLATSSSASRNSAHSVFINLSLLFSHAPKQQVLSFVETNVRTQSQQVLTHSAASLCTCTRDVSCPGIVRGESCGIGSSTPGDLASAHGRLPEL